MKADTQVQHDVIEELKWNPAIDANNISVEVKDGAVTLSGNVDNLRQTQRLRGAQLLRMGES